MTKKQKKSKTQEYIKLPKILYFSLLFILIIVYAQVRNFDFVWDDRELYLTEENFPQKFSFNDYLKFWDPASEKMYIPITYTIWTLAANTSEKNIKEKFNPAIYHTINLIIHIINTFIVLILLKKLLKNDWASFFGALIFGLHPLQAEAVAWISELRGLLAGLFAFITFLLYIKYLESRGEWINKRIQPNLYYYFSMLFTFLSVLSKPSAIVIPLIIFFIDYFLFQRKISLSIKSIIPFLIMIIPIMIRAKLAESALPPDFGSPLWARPFIFFDSLQFYLLKVIFPLDLAADYGRKPDYVLSSTSYYLAWILPVLLLGLLIYTIKQTRIYLASYLIFIAGFLALSGLVTFYFQDWSTVADRYLYISFFGVSIAIAKIFSDIKNNILSKTIGIFTIIIYAVLTFNQLKIWQNEFTLWDNNINKYPDKSAHSYTGRGYKFLDKGEYQKALNDFNKAIELNPKYSRVYYNRGIVFYDTEYYQKAIDDYTRAIELGFKHYDVFNNRGLSYAAINKFDSATSDYTSALMINPNQADTYVNRGISYAQLNNFELAIKDFQTALSLNPNDENARENLRYAQELLRLSKENRQ